MQDLNESIADGRRRRGDRSRQKIVNALLGLCGEGAITPSAEAVAKRARVGLRTVFRHFSDMETLYAEMRDSLDATMQPVYSKPLESTGWRDQLDELVMVLTHIYERLEPFWLATEVHSHSSRVAAEGKLRGVRMHRHAIERVLPASLKKNTDVVNGLLLVTSFEAWHRLRRSQNLGAAKALATMQRLVKIVLAA
jgi:AcrR family transcriptional regulator